MGRAIKKSVRIENVVLDQELYPRTNPYWHTIHVYSENLKAGAKFPPIEVATINGVMYLVDGKHRIEAHKKNKVEFIQANIHLGWNKQKVFLEAVKANVTHGQKLSPYELRKIAVRLKEMNLSQEDISKIIFVPQEKIESFVGERLVSSITNEPLDYQQSEQISKEIGQMILKSGVKQFAGATLSQRKLEEIESSQSNVRAMSQVRLLQEVVYLFDNNLLDTSNEQIQELLQRIENFIRGI